MQVHPAGNGEPPAVASPHANVDDPGEAPAAALELARRLGLSFTAADVLAHRGHTGGEDTARYLDPRLVHLTLPDAMRDREGAAERIASAVRRHERIVVFGDYDCDGMTSTALLCEVLRAVGGECVPMCASRFAGGYGLSAAALERVRAAAPGLLITCDCGSSDHERLEMARCAGIDSVVIDHHLVPDEPLPAIAFLNPHRPDCGFPYKGMASVGLAFSLAAALRRLLAPKLDLRPLLDLVAIGTVADVAPLDGDNRILVRAGLAVLASSARPGLAALASRLPGGIRAVAADVAYRVAPRLNAPGRLGAPTLALELLTCRDPARAAIVAAEIDVQNERRREVGRTIEAEALAEVAARGLAGDPAIALAREGWHAGVIGIVAGRLASRFGRPVAVVALDGARGVGSVRGPAGARLHDGLVHAASTLERFGGHQAAAGLEVRAERFGAFADLWREAFAAAAPSPAAAMVAEVRLDPRDDAEHVLSDLERLEPCGHANPAPRLALVEAVVRSARVLRGQHLRLELAHAGGRIEAFGPELGALADGLPGRNVRVVGRLQRSAFAGGRPTARGTAELLLDSVLPGDYR